MSGKKQKLVWQENLDIPVILLWAVAVAAGLFFGSRVANAQQYNQAWGFTTQNRASIAALMQQVEGNGANTAAAQGGFDTLVCGGDGASSATGNSTCIILNNATGNVEIGQDTEGNQDATNTATEKTLPNSDLGKTLASLNTLDD